jgi:putative addiction module component (TIGR02574 family)
MVRPLRKLANEALRLPEEERLALATELIDSVEEPEDPEWIKAWAIELDRRSDSADRRSVRGEPWSKIRSRLLRDLSRR